MDDEKKQGNQPPKQRLPKHVEGFFNQGSGAGGQRNINLDDIGSKPRWVSESDFKKIRPLESRHYDTEASGYYEVERHSEDPLEGKLPLQIPKDAGSYSTVTSIQNTDIPENMAQMFYNMMREEKEGQGSSRLRKNYEADVMGGLAMLKDQHPDYEQSIENAERMLWKLPLLGGPEAPSRRKLIMRKKENRDK